MPIVTYTSAQRAMRLSEHWTVGDLWLDKTMPTLVIDTALIAALEKMWAKFGPVKFVTARSIYCKTGHSANSYHYKGMAADFYAGSATPVEMAEYAEQIGMGGIGVYGPGNRHIHMDTRPRKTCWWIKTTGSKTPGFGGVPAVFKSGDRSPAVASIQNFLNEEGFNAGTADGVFGAKTEAALKAWQAANKLTADGKFGKSSENVAKIFSW